ncbi:MAG: hypothetical protein FD169_2053 [Bacillota bacterium]|nr:MAG: hypothetical protein FD169_2053 [Bacillota bacterium]
MKQNTGRCTRQAEPLFTPRGESVVVNMMNLVDIQDAVKRFTKENGLDSSMTVRIVDLASEVGELSKEVLRGTDYGNKPFEKTTGWESEVGDVLFSLICIANVTNTDLEECLNNVLDEYNKRFADKRDIGSRAEGSGD